MIFELMDAAGRFTALRSEDITQRASDILVLQGTEYGLFNRVGSECDAFAIVANDESFEVCVTIALPLTLGSCIYPAPLIWRTADGIASHFASPFSANKRMLTGISFSRLEDSDEELSEQGQLMCVDEILLDDPAINSESDEYDDETMSHDESDALDNESDVDDEQIRLAATDAHG